MWLLAALLPVTGYCAQDVRGHWTGVIEIPGQSLACIVDLDHPAKGWIGTIGIPAQNSSGMPLDAIALTSGSWTFRIKGVPGAPTFTGKLSEDGKTLAGDFTQGPGSFPFKLTREGEPKMEEVKASPAVAKEFTGTWEGAIDAGGQTLRLTLKLSNGADGAQGVMVSVDQGGVEIPVTTIDQKGPKLNLKVRAVGGEYDGSIDKEGSRLTGMWTQAGNTLALEFKKKP